MRNAFKYLTSLLFVGVVVQVALAGYGAFNAVDKSDDAGSITKDAVENGWNAHAVVGTIIVALMVVLVLVAALGRLGSPWLQWSGGLVLLGILQMLLAWLGASVAALGFLHAVNALAIYAAAALLAHRAWTRGGPTVTAPA
jgi:hypothetical protein